MSYSENVLSDNVYAEEKSSAKSVYTESRNRALQIASWVAGILFVGTFFTNFVYVGTEVTQGNVQRIFYLHLGTFFGSFVLFIAALVGGIQYLRTRNDKWDTLELSAIEMGLGFSLVNIVTGAVWARPIWNTWWTWDPRLTTVTIMWLTYAAYLMLRAGIEDPERRKRFAAVYAIIAFSSVILTVVIIRVRPDTIHPQNIGPSLSGGGEDAEGAFNFTPRIAQTLIYNIITYSVIAAVATWYRIRLQNRADEVEQRKIKLVLES